MNWVCLRIVQRLRNAHEPCSPFTLKDGVRTLSGGKFKTPQSGPPGPHLLVSFSLQVETIVDTLCNNMVGDKEQLRDISSIALKTVISELPLTSPQLAANGNFMPGAHN